jgi:dihydrofolate synthase/folylpolyglutamate synthase
MTRSAGAPYGADSPWLQSTRTIEGYEDAVGFFYSLASVGADVFRGGAGLQRSIDFMGHLGDPQEQALVIHVAGTAGKGSVCYALAAALQAKGFHAGLHVSPHVYDLRERFQLDLSLGPPDDVAEAASASLAAARSLRAGKGDTPTFFEATVGTAFQLFANRNVDYATIETGLGGLYDATNTVRRPDKLAVVTDIGLDHVSVLGSTRAEIAEQKAGIFPLGGTAIVSEPESPEVADVFRRVASARGTDLVWSAPAPGEDAEMPPFWRRNLALAEASLAYLAGRDSWEGDLLPALRAAREVRLPGRCELFRHEDGRVAVLDGAHNPMKVEAVLQLLDVRLGDVAPLAVVMACKEAKDAAGMLGLLGPRADPLIATEFLVPHGDAPGGATQAAARIAEEARRAGCASVVEEPAVSDAIRIGMEHEVLLVTGSFLYLGAARALLLADGYAAA